jgi:hypothetical protein
MDVILYSINLLYKNCVDVFQYCIQSHSTQLLQYNCIANDILTLIIKYNINVMCSIKMYEPGNMSSRLSTKYVDVLLLDACSSINSSNSNSSNSLQWCKK